VLAPATIAALPSTRAIETRSLPTSLAATHCGFAFYVAFSKSSIPSIATCSMSATPKFRRRWVVFLIHSIETRSLPTFARCYPSQLYLLCRSSHSLHCRSRSAARFRSSMMIVMTCIVASFVTYGSLRGPRATYDACKKDQFSSGSKPA
jgi:hypothetical protein